MVKFSILYRHPADESLFEQSYVANLALLEAMPGIRRRQANTVIGSPAGRSQFYRILEFYFDDNAAMDAALRSSAGQKAGTDLMDYAPDATLIFSEVYED